MIMCQKNKQMMNHKLQIQMQELKGLMGIS
jgi:hypothetical protein